MLDWKQIDGVIFDMDGTLLDSMAMWINLLPDYFAKHGKPYTDEILQFIVDRSLRQAADAVAAEFFPELGGAAMYQEWIDYLQHQYTNVVQIKEGVLPFLQTLQHMGKSMCVATMTDRMHAEVALRTHHIDPYFSFIKTVSEVGKGKEFPDIYLQAAAELGFMPERCLVVEDSAVACKVARNAGFLVCGVYDSEYACIETEMRQTCHCFVHNLLELLPREEKAGNSN